MTDRPDEKTPVVEMTQIEAMDTIVSQLDKVLGYLGSATRRYKQNLSKRRFAKKEMELLDESYSKALTVWYAMKKRKEREEKK